MKKTVILIFVIAILLIMNKLYCSELTSLEQLKEAWPTYKSYFVQNDGRVVDHYAQSVSTSEGQSYALLRAVLLDDRPTFDKVLEWTNNNLKVRGDNLFSWKWGQKNTGEWTILEKASASDADEDIALALILAQEKWKDQKYLDQAKQILNDMWGKEIVCINGKYYLVPGEWSLNDKNMKINPSYFAPYAYKVFAKIDSGHNWSSLVDTSYEVLDQASSHSVVFLPPDWAYLNKDTGEVTINTDLSNKDSDFSYDAIRVFWRISLDGALNKEQRATDYLKKSCMFLINYWKVNGNLPSDVTYSGVIRKGEESYAIYGSSLPALALVDPQVANEIYYKKLAGNYYKGYWGNPQDYYAQNLIWFGIELWRQIDSKHDPSKTGLMNLLNN